MDKDSPERVYRVPDNAVIEQYAYQVCHDLGQDFQSIEVKRGFASFLKVVAKIYANNGDQLQERE